MDSGTSSIKKALPWGCLAAFIVLLTYLFFLPLNNLQGVGGEALIALLHTRAIEEAVSEYAANHQNHLPNSLQELGPTQVAVWQGWPPVFLATPGAALADLPKNSVILFSAGRNVSTNQTVLITVRPDFRLEVVERPEGSTNQ